MDRNTRLRERRDSKFAKHGVEITEESTTETRTVGKDKDGQPIHRTFNFTHAVYQHDRLVGRTESWFSALKRGHQQCKNNPKR